MPATKEQTSVALIAGSALADAVPSVLEATEAASPRPTAHLDARAEPADALARLDPMLRDHGTVTLLADLEQAELGQLLQQVDRAVAIVGGRHEVARLAEVAAEHGVAGRPLEAILAGKVSLPAEAGDAVRVVRRLARPAPTDRDTAWLGRHLSRTKLGLALGAGGARSYALVGALAVLEEAGYRVDAVAGSGIGAIVGTWVALGMSAREIEMTMRETFTPEVVAETLKISLSGQSAGYETMVGLLRDLAGGHSFADCSIPLAIMTADLTERRAAPLRDGPLDEALIAATALAGVFPPYERDEHRLVDGLAVEPVPTSAVIADGADVTVSVNLIPRETLPAWPGEEPPPAPEPRLRGARMLDTLLEVMDLAQLDTSERGAALADVSIAPRFGPGGWRDFHLADQFLAAGREAAEERLADLGELAGATASWPAETTR